MLDTWPALPIAIGNSRILSPWQGTDNIMAALEQHDRVSKIRFNSFVPNSLFEELAAMKRPFPELTYLLLRAPNDENAPALVLPESFLDGSAPRLQELTLCHVTFPALPKLLLTTTDLVQLELHDIPDSGYNLPEAMATSLASLKRLIFLSLKFRSPRSQADGASRHPPSLTPAVLPALTYFCFHGDSDYLEVIVSGIDAPILEDASLIFFRQPVFDLPLLRRFIGRTATSRLPQQAEVLFQDHHVRVDLFRLNGTDDKRTIALAFSCIPQDGRLSPLVRLCSSALPPLSSLERLEVHQYRNYTAGYMENSQWLEFFRPFSSVKDLVVPSKKLVRLIAPAVAELAGQSVAEVLPVLQNIFLQWREPSEPVQEAINQFIATRQLSGCPVALHQRW